MWHFLFWSKIRAYLGLPFWTCLFLLCLWAAVFPTFSQAQFQGGRGDGYDMAELSVTLTALDKTLPKAEPCPMAVFPNPFYSAERQHIAIRLENTCSSFQINSQLIAEKNYALWLQDAQGKRWQLSFETPTENTLTAKIPQTLASGWYLLILLPQNQTDKTWQSDFLIQK
jgi:hypothetical protein